MQNEPSFLTYANPRGLQAMKTIFAATFAAAALLSTTLRAEEALVTIAAPAADSMVAAQWVQANADGTIAGTVVPGRAPVAAGKVSLLADKGSVIETDVNSSGKFELSGVAPGVYTLSYVAEDAFAAYAIHVVAPRQDRSFAKSLVVTASALDPQRARTTIARYQPARVDLLSPVEYNDAPATLLPPTREQARYQVARNSTGGVDGRLIRAGSVEGGLAPAAGVNVLIIQDEVLVGQAISAADGMFQIAGLAPGQYDMIASGTAGFAALGFEVIDAVEPLAQESDNNPFRLASAQMQDTGGGLEVQLAPPTVDAFEGGPIVEEEILAPEFVEGPPMGGPMGGPGAGGGFGGGGGGGGGLGGAGGLLALGGIAAAIALGLDDEDDDEEEASPAGGRGPGFNVPPRGRPDFERPRGPDRGRGRD